jgi:hypothetical protein
MRLEWIEDLRARKHPNPDGSQSRSYIALLPSTSLASRRFPKAGGLAEL